MNKKKLTIIGSTSFAVLLVWLLVPFAETQSFNSFDELSTEGLSEFADLIVVAKYKKTVTEQTFDDNVPLRDVHTFKVLDVLKGQYDERIIDVFDYGEGASFANGYRTEVTMMMSKATYANNEKAVLFLDYDEGNELGDGYYLLSGPFGKFTVDGEHAKNHNAVKNSSFDDLKTKINRNK